MDTTIQVTLVVKGTPDRAAQEVVARLNTWFLEDVNNPAPYEAGSLLYWSQKAVNHTPKGGN